MGGGGWFPERVWGADFQGGCGRAGFQGGYGGAGFQTLQRKIPLEWIPVQRLTHMQTACSGRNLAG